MKQLVVTVSFDVCINFTENYSEDEIMEILTSDYMGCYGMDVGLLHQLRDKVKLEADAYRFHRVKSCGTKEFNPRA